MPTFPKLSTGAITQYPATTKVVFGPTRVVDFLDGSSHRYCTGPKALRQWLISLDGLGSGESAVVSAFLRSNQYGVFSFLDPFTGDTVPRCALRDGNFTINTKGEASTQLNAVIEERP